MKLTLISREYRKSDELLWGHVVYGKEPPVVGLWWHGSRPVVVSALHVTWWMLEQLRLTFTAPPTLSVTVDPLRDGLSALVLMTHDVWNHVRPRSTPDVCHQRVSFSFWRVKQKITFKLFYSTSNFRIITDFSLKYTNMFTCFTVKITSLSESTLCLCCLVMFKPFVWAVVPL